ncbi:MAG: hypothetical protein PHC94_03645 [Methylobacter sp.]|nr:hypothetical protein [Methylobacter sp.]MDO9163298.1 hypothetical protein [Methylococcaceae bacterium]MDZ4157715.1 hypothetical protein [Methylococcales bacterium]MDP2392731.1 hypothetical protein [Methylococcaceae bacterium]MDP3390419.1 hypothetical protein [Methylococcaceae bacterium]
MSIKFYGPTAGAEAIINQLLKLPATGKEQDWEFEFANPTKIEEMLDVFTSKELDLESKSALALLIISSMEEAEEAGTLDSALIFRATQLIAINDEVRNRMYFYWIELGRANNVVLVKKLISMR